MTTDLHADSEQAPGRYGCLERREDAELVVQERLHSESVALYHAHLRGCEACRREHQVLVALYRGPDPSSSGLGSLRRDQEFAAILRKVRSDRPAPWYARLAAPLALAGVAAAVLALLPARGRVEHHSTDAGLIVRLSEQPASAGEPPPGLDHRAQADYGRVIAGSGVIMEGERPVATDTFAVGTRLQVDTNGSLQVGLVGKILANFGPNSQVYWARVEPSTVELHLERGMIAVRYERLPSDPILRIRTPTATVRVVGTVFTVQVDPHGTVVSVLRGAVEVLDPRTEELLAEVSAGYRFDLARLTYADVGRDEVRIAMPLSDEATRGDAPADGTVPSSWVVPGLPDVPSLRRLEHIVDPATIETPAPTPAERTPNERSGRSRPLPNNDDDGKALIEKLVRDSKASRREQIMASLAHCQDLYESPETRYLSARCLTQFMAEHDDVVEGHLVIGILRMDYANDYPAAKKAFQTFIDRAPEHPDAEVARYRLWLASTENGDIHEAIQQGRHYLRRYPDGKYAGKVLQRFPQLISEL